MQEHFSELLSAGPLPPPTPTAVAVAVVAVVGRAVLTDGLGDERGRSKPSKKTPTGGVNGPFPSPGVALVQNDAITGLPNYTPPHAGGTTTRP